MRYMLVHPVADLMSMFTFISGCDSKRKMQLNRISSAALVSLIVHLYVASSYAKPVSMYIKMESTGVNYVYVNFYNDMFQRLYNCITDLKIIECKVHFQYHGEGAPYPTLNNYNVTSVTSTGTQYMVQGYFICQNNQSASSVQCIRKRGQCGGNCTSFRLSNASMCQCAYLMWTYPNETLVFNNKTDGIEYCKQECAETTTVHSAELSSYPSVTSLPSEQSSNATNMANFGRDESSNTVPVIIGVVCGVILIAVIVIAVGFIYRRKKQTKRQVSNNGNNSSRTNTSYNNGGPARSNASNIPDVLSTLPYSSHGSGTNRESEDGYYTIDKDYGLNRYENGLNTVFSKASQRPAEGILSSRGLNKYTNELRVSPHTSHIYEDDAGNSEMSHALEGEYFTIETKNDDGVKNETVEIVPNSRHLNKYTNEIRVSPQTSHTGEGNAVNSEMAGTPEGDYFTIDTENDGDNNKPIKSVLNFRRLNTYTNELRVSTQTLHVDEGEAVQSEPLHAPEGDYFTLETENDFAEDETTVDEEQNIDGGYSLAKDVDIIDEAAIIDVIDVSPPPKNVYSKFADNNNTEMKNPYDTLLEKHQILNSRKTSVD